MTQKNHRAHSQTKPVKAKYIIICTAITYCADLK